MKPEGTEWFFKPQLEFLITTSLCSTKEVSNEIHKTWCCKHKQSIWYDIVGNMILWW